MKIQKPNVLILGMLLEKPLSPYDMVRLAETINPSYWISVAKPTFYVNVQKLAKVGLVKGETTKQGKMPDKTIYSLTELGRETITKAILNFLASDELDPEMFRLSIFFLSHLQVQQEELYPHFLARIKLLEKLEEELMSKYPDASELPLNIRIIIDHTLLTLRAEITITKKLREVISDQKWEEFTKLSLDDMKKY